LSIIGAIVVELLDLANAYCETDLKRHCINMVKQGVTVGNVAFLYSTAIEYNAEVAITAFAMVNIADARHRFKFKMSSLRCLIILRN
jgi:hypothetical protein